VSAGIKDLENLFRSRTCKTDWDGWATACRLNPLDPQTVYGKPSPYVGGGHRANKAFPGDAGDAGSRGTSCPGKK